MGPFASYDIIMRVEETSGVCQRPDDLGCTKVAQYIIFEDFSSVHIFLDDELVRNHSSIHVAAVMMHEMIHANLYLWYYKNTGLPLPHDQGLPELLDYYIEHNEHPDFPEWDHEFMVDHYTQTIEDGLRTIFPQLGLSEFQNENNYSQTQMDEFYDALAWNGLWGTSDWNALSQSQKNNIIGYITDAKNSNTGCNQ